MLTCGRMFELNTINGHYYNIIFVMAFHRHIVLLVDPSC